MHRFGIALVSTCFRSYIGVDKDNLELVWVDTVTRFCRGSTSAFWYRLYICLHELVRSIETGTLRQVDTQPPFRTLVKHKALKTEWVINNLPDRKFVLTFFAEDISDCVYSLIYAP